jgi:hypothetical protein
MLLTVRCIDSCKHFDKAYSAVLKLAPHKRCWTWVINAGKLNSVHFQNNYKFNKINNIRVETVYFTVNIFHCFRFLYILAFVFLCLWSWVSHFFRFWTWSSKWNTTNKSNAVSSIFFSEEYSVILVKPLEQAGLPGYTWDIARHTVGVTTLLRYLTGVMNCFTNSQRFHWRIICNVNMTCDMTDDSKDWCHVLYIDNTLVELFV